jgi:transposase
MHPQIMTESLLWAGGQTQSLDSASNHINCLEWPAQSPDLNVIENVWLKLKIRLQQRVEVLNTADKLSAAIKDIWENLSVDYIQGLYHSIPKRLRKVLKVKGEMTKY